MFTGVARREAARWPKPPHTDGGVRERAAGKQTHTILSTLAQPSGTLFGEIDASMSIDRHKPIGEQAT